MVDEHELYLDGQATAADSALFTGYRWENRFRLLTHEHWINPVLYVEFENINGADKTLLEVINHDGKDDLIAPNADARQEKQREVEAKLILGSYYKGWTIAENFITEKNIEPRTLRIRLCSGDQPPSGIKSGTRTV